MLLLSWNRQLRFREGKEDNERIREVEVEGDAPVYYVRQGMGLSLPWLASSLAGRQWLPPRKCAFITGVKDLYHFSDLYTEYRIGPPKACQGV
jgi:hypothetical protein